MGILTNEVEVRVNAFTIKHYESLGYKIPLRKASKSSFQHTGKEFVYDLNNTFVVKVEDLQRKSNVKIDVSCDCCGDTIYGITYEDYCKRIEMFGEYVCSKCKLVHYKKSCLKIYGIDNPAKLKEIKEQMAETSLKRYGTTHPMQSLEIKKKTAQTLYKNGTTPTSRQQLYVYNIYCIHNDNKPCLNYPIFYYNADICFPDEKLDIEVDFGGHNLSVKTGKLTQEEFNQKEIIRNNVIKREGYKQMRIISEDDKLPSDSTLLQMLSNARNYFSEYPNHSWIEFNLDTSLVRNAENKQGVPYDFGTLRRIKDEDLQQTTTKKGA